MRKLCFMALALLLAAFTSPAPSQAQPPVSAVVTPSPSPEPADEGDASVCSAPCWFDEKMGLWYCPCEGGYVGDELTGPPPPVTWPPAGSRART